MKTKHKKLGTVRSGDIYLKTRLQDIDNNGNKVTLNKYIIILGVEDKDISLLYGIKPSNNMKPHVATFELIEVDGEFEYPPIEYTKPKYTALDLILRDILDDSKKYGSITGEITYDKFVDFVMKSESRTLLVWTLTNVIMAIGFLITAIFS